MSTRAVFFVGQGEKAVMLGAVYEDGYPENENGHGVPASLLRTDSPEDFERAVLGYLISVRGDRVSGHTWRTVGGGWHIYAFFRGHVWISVSGFEWHNPFIKAVPPKNPPVKPVGHRGSISGDLRVVCGKCIRSKRVTLSRLDRLFGRDNWDAKDMQRYFEQRGFICTRMWGWLCKHCTSS